MADPRAERSRVHRHPERADYDRQTLYRVLDAAATGHVGFVRRGEPVVLPTVYGRRGDVLYLHGSRAAGMFGDLAGGAAVCVTVTLTDGIVLAASVYNHSMNYRSAVVFGHADLVVDPDEVMLALQAVTEQIMPGRWQEARPPNRAELRATRVMRVPIEEASVKIRSGPPQDAVRDAALSVWTGVVPLSLTAGPPEAQRTGRRALPLPRYVADYVRRAAAPWAAADGAASPD
jgi:nitroimidazol reductase NimA-like FMN-containing flavoprotein (pyridoxamine 5'-phosphate oxidase superfamily)